MGANGEDARAVSTSGWSTRLYWLWILYNAVAFVVVLTVSRAGLDRRGCAASGRGQRASAGRVAGGNGRGFAVRWRARIPAVAGRPRARAGSRKRWIVANVGPSLLGWLLVIIPAVVTAKDTGASVSGAYLLAASQTLALGPLLGLSQASVLRGYTRRWAWWIAANISSWLIVDAVFYLLSRWIEALDFTRHDGSIAQVYLMLIASTPLTGRMLLWVLAPSALLSQQQAAA